MTYRYSRGSSDGGIGGTGGVRLVRCFGLCNLLSTMCIIIIRGATRILSQYRVNRRATGINNGIRLFLDSNKYIASFGLRFGRIVSFRG